MLITSLDLREKFSKETGLLPVHESFNIEFTRYLQDIEKRILNSGIFENLSGSVDPFHKYWPKPLSYFANKIELISSDHPQSLQILAIGMLALSIILVVGIIFIPLAIYERNTKIKYQRELKEVQYTKLEIARENQVLVDAEQFAKRQTRVYKALEKLFLDSYLGKRAKERGLPIYEATTRRFPEFSHQMLNSYINSFIKEKRTIGGAYSHALGQKGRFIYNKINGQETSLAPEEFILLFPVVSAEGNKGVLTVFPKEDARILGHFVHPKTGQSCLKQIHFDEQTQLYHLEKGEKIPSEMQLRSKFFSVEDYCIFFLSPIRVKKMASSNGSDFYALHESPSSTFVGSLDEYLDDVCALITPFEKEGETKIGFSLLTEAHEELVEIMEELEIE